MSGEEYTDLFETERDAEEKVLAKNNQKYYNEITACMRRGLENPDTRKILYEIFKMCRFFDATVPNEEAAVHAEGRRLIGVLLKTRLEEIDSTAFYQIFTEGVRYEEAVLEIGRLPHKQK